MTAPENEQTDIIPALRPEAGDTAVDAFAPVAGARHRRPSRPRLLPVAGVAAIVVAGVAAMYATYTLGGHTPTVPAPAPSVVSEEPIAVEPPSPSLSSPVTRPSRTKADRRSPRPTPTRPARSPAPATTATSPSPARTSPSPTLRTSPATAPPASDRPDPPPTTGVPQSPTEVPEVESS